jgi:hypothetical protein
MDLNLRRRARERAIAAEVVNELFETLRPAMDAGADPVMLIAEHRPLVAHIFGAACERNGLQTEAEVKRAFAYIAPTVASLNRRYGKLASKVEAMAVQAERQA